MEHFTGYYSRASIGTEAHECAKWIGNYYTGLGLDIAYYDWSSDTTNVSPWNRRLPVQMNTYSPNVIGILKGSSVKDVVIISGHYDSRGPLSRDNATEKAPGTDDNASGATMVLEAARIAVEKYNNTLLPYTVHFLSTSGEEDFLYGAFFYGRSLVNAGYNVRFVINADMISYLAPGDALQIALIEHQNSELNPGNWTNDSNEYAMKILRKQFPSIPVGYSSGCCSDEMAFMHFNIPAISFFERIGKIYSDNPVYHTPGDIISRANYSQVALITDAALTILDDLQAKSSIE